MPARAYSSPAASPLAHSTLVVRIIDLVAEHTLTHRFENQGSVPLEAVYSFPLPLDAAFMGLSATLAGETLHAQVHAKPDAERHYDDAIADGNSAVLLTQPEPGVLCVSLGNLLPGERGEIDLRFATALRVADRQARFSLPLVHRPRYGQWRLEALETPSHDFLVEHPLDAHIEVTGLLGDAPTRCVTHGARFTHTPGNTRLDIDAAMLDRDLVLAFDLATDLPSRAHLVRDGERNLASASLVLPARNTPPAPLDVCLLLDGSGSMEGDAIAQSRLALLAVTDALGDADRLQVLRFGSSCKALFRRPLKLTKAVRASVTELAGVIQADLGGTEMGAALDHALRQFAGSESGRSKALILVTDGAVQAADIRRAQEAAQASGIRIFVVAVGSAAGVEVLAPLAAATGAVLERAVPAEPIDTCVLRQLRRAREPQPLAVQVQWPQSAQPIVPAVAYPGDAIDVAALLPSNAAGELIIQVSDLDFHATMALPPAAEAPALRAMLGARRYAAAPADERAALALHYGLLTDETAAVLVKERAVDERPDSLPQTVKVESMLPDGMLSIAEAPMWSKRRRAHDSIVCSESMDYLDIPAFLPGDNSDIYESVACEAPAPVHHAADALPRDERLTIARSLLTALLAQLGNAPNLDAAIQTLPVEQKAHAIAWLDGLGVDSRTLQSAVTLLLALLDVLDTPPMTDEQEAALATWTHCYAMDAEAGASLLVTQLRSQLD